MANIPERYIKDSGKVPPYGKHTRKIYKRILGMCLLMANIPERHIKDSGKVPPDGKHTRKVYKRFWEGYHLMANIPERYIKDSGKFASVLTDHKDFCKGRLLNIL